MTNTHKFAPVLGKRIRVTQMNDDGTVGGFYIATDGFITVSLAAQVEDGTEIITRNAFGQLCVNEKLNPTFKRFDVELELCGVNPTLLSYMTNAKTYADYAGDAAGITIGEGEIIGQFALEVWTGLSGALNDTHADGYMLLPLIGKGNVDDIKVDGENAIDFNVKGASTRGGNQWGRGPYDVVSGSGTNEVQQLAMTGVPTGGTFTLAFGSGVTTAIPYNAIASVVQTALEALSTVEVGDIVVSGGPGPTTPYVFTFGNNLAYTNVPSLVVVASLTGGTSPAAAITTTTPGVAGAASILPVALDEFDHFLLIDTSIAAPLVNEQPTVLVPASH